MKFDINKKEENILEAIERLVAVNSVRDLQTQKDNAPFGAGVREAMDIFLEIAEEWGFRTGDCEGYAVFAEIGPELKDHIGVLGHLDIVSAGDIHEWDTDPFTLTQDDGYLYARGINDDKGPLIAALWAARAAYEETEMDLPIRVIAGGAEETTWECMDMYFKHHPQPVMGFSPDGNFPIVNGEMGMIQLSLIFENATHLKAKSEIQYSYNCSDITINGTTAKSGRVLSRNPHRSDHAIFNWIKNNGTVNDPVLLFIESHIATDVHGSELGIDSSHEEMGVCNVCVLSLNTCEDNVILDLDIRYPISTSEEEILSELKVLGHTLGFNCKKIKGRRPLYVSRNHPLILKLKEAYEAVVGEPAACITKGGASYARVMTAGVAFGATFEGEDPRPHMPNERMLLVSLMRATDIYIQSLKLLSSSQ